MAHVSQIKEVPIDFQHILTSISSVKHKTFKQESEEVNSENNIFKGFFQNIDQPAFIFDLNVNSKKERPYIANNSASSLISLSNQFFENSRLRQFNGTLSDFLYSARRKVEERIQYMDLLHVLISSGTETVEAIYGLTASSFTLDNETKILGILLIEITKTIKDELDALETFKSSLISALSHEFNNPLNSLIPLLDMMPSCYNDDKKEDIKEMALTSATILQNKIRDLIDYSKMQQEKIKLNFTEFYVNDLFEGFQKLFKHEAKEKSNVLITKVGANGKTKLKILGDRDRIEQVLLKLMSNANKYTTNGKIQLIAEENSTNFNIVFSVKDTGVGISKRMLATLFASLPQKSKHLESVARLPGLGLDVAKSICQRMHSKLNVSSEEGKGTTFSFELPVCRIVDFDDVQVSRLSENKIVEKAVEISCKPDIQEEVKNKTKLNDKEVEDAKLFDKSLLKTCGNFRNNPDHSARSSSKKQKLSNFTRKALSCRREQPPNLNISSPLIESELDNKRNIIAVSQIIPKYTSVICKKFNKTISLRKSSLEKVEEKVKKTVALIVDDIYSNRMVIRMMIKRLGIESIEATNGQKAVEAMESSFLKDSDIEIGLILMDLNMPVMNGVKATMEIRELERKYGKSYETAIIAVTAHDAKNERKECFTAGMQDYVVKPVNSETLKQIVKQYAPGLIKKIGLNASIT